MKTISLCCEGPKCNGGLSAEAREALITHSLPGATEVMRAELAKDARGAVSRALTVTPHARLSGVDRWGRTRYMCTVCHAERVYGMVMDHWRGEGTYA